MPPNGMRAYRQATSLHLNKQAIAAMADPALHWYALQTAPQQEWKAHVALGAINVPALLPSKSRWRRENRYQKAKKRIRYALIPRLLFVGFPPGRERFREVLVGHIAQSVIGVAGVPAAIQGRSLAAWLRQVGAETEAPKEQRHMRTGAEFAVGDKAMVIDGALEGRIVDVKSIRGSSARVLADWMLAVREIEVPTMMLEKIQ